MGASCCSNAEHLVAPSRPPALPSPAPPAARLAITADSSAAACMPSSSPTKRNPSSSPESTTAVSKLVRSAHFLLRKAQLQEAQQQLPTTAKYLAWHLIYDSKEHGGLCPSTLYARCAQCMQDTTGILTPPQPNSPVGASTRGSVTASSVNEGSHDAAVQGLPEPPLVSSSSKKHHRRRRRSALLIETQCLVYWHPSTASAQATGSSPPPSVPQTVSSHRLLGSGPQPVACHVGIGLFLDKLPSSRDAIVSLKPEELRFFTFLVPQVMPVSARLLRGPSATTATPPAVTAPAPSHPYMELDEPEPHALTDTDVESSVITSTPPPPLPLLYDAKESHLDGQRRLSSLLPSETSSVSLEDVVLTANPQPQDLHSPNSTHSHGPITSSSASSSVDTETTRSEESLVTVFTTEEKVTVLRTCFRVGRPLHCCRTWTAASPFRPAKGRSRAGVHGEGSYQPVVVQAAEPTSVRLTTRSLANRTGASGDSVSSQARRAVYLNAVPRQSHPAGTDRDSAPLICMHCRLSSAEIEPLTDRAQSFLTDASLSTSFGRPFDQSTFVLVSPTSTALESVLTASRAGVLTEVESGPVFDHGRVSSMFPTPPSTTTNTQSMGLDVSNGDMYSPFSATNEHSPINDGAWDGTAAEDARWASTPVLDLQFFPVEQRTGDTSPVASKTNPTRVVRKSKEPSCIQQAFLLATSDSGLSFWTESASKHTSMLRKGRRRVSVCAERAPDIGFSETLQHVTLNMEAPLFRSVKPQQQQHGPHRPTSETASRTTLGTINASNAHGLSDDEACCENTSRSSLPAADLLTTQLIALLPPTGSRGHFSVPFSAPPPTTPMNGGRLLSVKDDGSPPHGTGSHAEGSSSFSPTRVRQQVYRDAESASSTGQCTVSCSPREKAHSASLLRLPIAHIQLCAVGEW